MPHAESCTITPRTTGDWRDDLFRDGYAVVKGAVPAERAAEYVQHMYNWLEKFPLGFSRHDPATWTDEHLPVHFKGGMYHGYAVAHEKFVWDARLEPGVIDAFAKLWDTRDLLVSFDGINLTLPPSPSVTSVTTTSVTTTSPTTPASSTTTAWPHVDQSPQRKGLQCVQGIINLSPNGPNDGGLLVMKGSHLLNEEFFATNAVDENTWGPQDWFGFNEEQLDWFRKRGGGSCEVVKVCAEPGDLLVWDSRCVHYNEPPKGGRERAVVYACYTPARFASKEDLAKKKQIFENRQRTTHWPHANIFVHDAQQLRFGKPDPYARNQPFEEPEITEELLKLAGAMPY